MLVEKYCQLEGTTVDILLKETPRDGLANRQSDNWVYTSLSFRNPKLKNLSAVNALPRATYVTW